VPVISIDWLIITYGYPVLFVGTLFEGETAVIIAGFLARRGYLRLPLVVLVAFLGTFAADQFFFWLGHSRGKAFLEKRPAWQSAVAKGSRLFERHGLWLIVGFRFLYGLRTVIPIVIGISGFSPRQFILFNAIGALIWAVIIAYAGYAFGQVFELILDDLHRYELWIALGLAVGGSAIWLYYFLKHRNQAQES
jgi:membrane protein DedA with SNARE-associated domain